MVFSELLISVPYKIVWNIFSKRNNDLIHFYCGELLDWYIFRDIFHKFPNAKLIAKNRKLKKQLAELDLASHLWPVFPKVVIMARHATHKFPAKKIVKIGMRHGPFHFKKFIDAKKYNSFDLFLFTSQYEVKQAKAIGIKCAEAGGYPKLDDMFNGNITKMQIQDLRAELNFDQRPVILFSATWERSGMSAVQAWCDKLGRLTKHYNILATLHPWTNSSIKTEIAATTGVHLIDSLHIAPYLILADVMVGDTSSILAEFCALKKPIITFKTRTDNRLDNEVKTILGKISHQIEDFEQLADTLSYALKNREQLVPEQNEANKKFFLPLDRDHSSIAFHLIEKFLSTAFLNS